MSTLTAAETERFYRLWFQLLSYANEQLHVVGALPAEPEPGSVDPDTVDTVRDVLWKNDEVLERFVAENPASLSPADISAVAAWRLRVSGDFVVIRHLKRHSLFLHGHPGHPDRVYGVVGLTTPLAEMLPSPALPRFVRAVLLPFEGRIIYDSQFGAMPVTFGPGARRSMREATRRATAREGVITTLDDSPRPAPRSRKVARPPLLVVPRGRRRPVSRGDG
ncbi:MAG: hypothetical protein QME96_13555 [Myxococcota bacterium]|nr:hypothetical protein [Myxococcota bacterium]